jgi:predicted transcriptional regulator
MNDQLLVLNALLRLARRRIPASFSEIEARVGTAAVPVGTALAALARSGLVRRKAGGGAIAQLTLDGLALAVALARQSARGRKTPPIRSIRHAA